MIPRGGWWGTAECCRRRQKGDGGSFLRHRIGHSDSYRYQAISPVIRPDAGLSPRRLLSCPPQPIALRREFIQFAQLFKRRPYGPGPFRHLPAVLPQFPNGVVRILPCPLRLVFVGVDDKNPFAVILNQDCRLFLHFGWGEAVAGETPALPGRPSESALHVRFARPLWIVAPYEQNMLIPIFTDDLGICRRASVS
jgi:hypothetical protein